MCVLVTIFGCEAKLERSLLQTCVAILIESSGRCRTTSPTREHHRCSENGFGDRFTVAYALAASKLLFTDINNIGKLAKGAAVVYEKLKIEACRVRCI